MFFLQDIALQAITSCAQAPIASRAGSYEGRDLGDQQQFTGRGLLQELALQAMVYGLHGVVHLADAYSVSA
ncbi:hypothetical protein [Limnohabitans planktonicus]|uniref:Uncharacterized protein n=1 Tax=Limnohabitans planktonicus II-D5 TaxID=1293045 RepID=A0A2T7UF05_9BURK|nr:hypothetical protein [Limnohabitans planktonicus]PVE43181.1 hypothetical protein H663_007760 [Limnohabitans planktonicus II-D5]